ncbi:hypothetical protein IW262DRAFT_397079 [Armillaria fumosa]|nr:hypothetical protein IW262DRAFT_397079 [Armillaria fumosa]
MPKRNNTCPSKLLPASLPVRPAELTFFHSYPVMLGLGRVLSSPQRPLSIYHSRQMDNFLSDASFTSTTSLNSLGLILVLLMFFCRQARGRTQNLEQTALCWCLVSQDMVNLYCERHNSRPDPKHFISVKVENKGLAYFPVFWIYDTEAYDMSQFGGARLSFNFLSEAHIYPRWYTKERNLSTAAHCRHPKYRGCAYPPPVTGVVMPLPSPTSIR